MGMDLIRIGLPDENSRPGFKKQATRKDLFK
jgi:hypothetical protein